MGEIYHYENEIKSLPPLVQFLLKGITLNNKSKMYVLNWKSNENEIESLPPLAQFLLNGIPLIFIKWDSFK